MPLRQLPLHILHVLSCDNFVACVGVVHHRFGMREEVVQSIVEDTSDHKGVDVANCEAVGYEYQYVVGMNDGLKTYRCWPPSETPVLPLPAATILLTKPGSGGTQPMKKATKERQLVANLGW